MIGAEAAAARTLHAPARSRRFALQLLRTDGNHGLVGVPSLPLARRTDRGRTSAGQYADLHSRSRTGQPVPIGVPGEIHIARRRRDLRIPESSGADGGKVYCRSVLSESRTRRCTRRAIWAAFCPTDASSSRAASTTRSKCAATASSWARSKTVLGQASVGAGMRGHRARRCARATSAWWATWSRPPARRSNVDRAARLGERAFAGVHGAGGLRRRWSACRCRRTAKSIASTCRRRTTCGRSWDASISRPAPRRKK